MAEEQKKKHKKVKKEAHGEVPETKTKRYKVVLGIIVVALLAAVAIMAYLLLNREKPPQEPERPTVDTGARGTVATEENIDELVAAANATIEDANYTVSMSMDWDYDRWDRPMGNVYVRNHAINTRTVYFDVFLNDADGSTTDNLIYSSPYLEVGAEIAGFPLDKEVAAGNYTATVVFNLVDDEHNEITDVALNIGLNIHN